MSPGINLSIHWWRGIGADVQLSLFYHAVRFGFVTISFERDWLFDHYRTLREDMEKRVAWDRAQNGEQPRNAHGFPSVSASRG
jgi:hypothetical protein